MYFASFVVVQKQH